MGLVTRPSSELCRGWWSPNAHRASSRGGCPATWARRQLPLWVRTVWTTVAMQSPVVEAGPEGSSYFCVSVIGVRTESLILLELLVLLVGAQAELLNEPSRGLRRRGGKKKKKS